MINLVYFLTDVPIQRHATTIQRQIVMMDLVFFLTGAQIQQLAITILQLNVMMGTVHSQAA